MKKKKTTTTRVCAGAYRLLECKRTGTFRSRLDAMDRSEMRSTLINTVFFANDLRQELAARGLVAKLTRSTKRDRERMAKIEAEIAAELRSREARTAQAQADAGGA